MSLFLISATRSIIEMLGLCLMAQGVLAVICGRRRALNPVYRLFALITSGPRSLLASILPERIGGLAVGIICFVLLLFFWLALAWLREFN